MTLSRLIAAAALVGVAAYLLAWPVAIEPVAWTLAPNPGLTGPFAHSEGFADLRPLALDLGEGPEAVTQAPDGWLYTGLQDRQVVQFRPAGWDRWNEWCRPAAGRWACSSTPQGT